jgi:DNA-binding MarR family transcriptional regulator
MTDDSRIELARQIITVLPKYGVWARSIRDFTTPYGKLGFRQLSILWSLRYQDIPPDELSPSSLARFHRVRPSVVTRALARLEEGGFIERTMDLQDRRRINLAITQKGIHVSTYVEHLYLSEIIDSMDPMDPAEIATLLRAVATFDRIITRLEASGHVPVEENDEAIAEPPESHL